MLILLSAIALQAEAASAPPPASPCSYDRATMNALDQQAFDQDMKGGWRALGNAGCDLAAADAIRSWRAAHPPSRFTGLLYWHEGQLRANAGQTDAALRLFKKARMTAREDAGFGWNLYVDGTIAFLKRNRPALDAAHAALAALPRPADFNPIGPDGKPATVRWPMNLNVLDAFQRCWGQPHKQAYACATPMLKVNAPADASAK